MQTTKKKYLFTYCEYCMTITIIVIIMYCNIGSSPGMDLRGGIGRKPP